jgi:hypothetical protein
MPKVEEFRQPCEHRADLERADFVEKGLCCKYDPFRFRVHHVVWGKGIEDPLCSLLVNAMRVFDDTNLLGIRDWQLNVLVGGLH